MTILILLGKPTLILIVSYLFTIPTFDIFLTPLILGIHRISKL